MNIKLAAEKSLMTNGHYFGQDIDEGNFKVINISKRKKVTSYRCDSRNRSERARERLRKKIQ